MALFRCGAGAEKLQLEKGSYIAARAGAAPTTGTYTSGTAIISTNGFGSGAVIAPNTSSTQINVGGTQFIAIAGLKDGVLVDPYSTSGASVTRTYNDCDLIFVLSAGGSGANSITVTDL